MDFISNNLSFLIFLFLLAAPLLGKLRKSMGTPEESRPEARMPSFGGERSDQDMERKEKERKAAIRAAQRQYEEQQRKQEQSSDAGDGDRRTQAAPEASRSGRSSGLPVVKPAAAASSYGNTELRVEEEDLAQGVVWAEILGPPRAKRPYRR